MRWDSRTPAPVQIAVGGCSGGCADLPRTKFRKPSGFGAGRVGFGRFTWGGAAGLSMGFG